MTTKAHTLLAVDPDSGVDLEHKAAWIHRASTESVAAVLYAPENDDGRSEWVWLRLASGDLILGLFPKGDTYFAVEEDAQYPGDEP